MTLPQRQASGCSEASTSPPHHSLGLERVSAMQNMMLLRDWPKRCGPCGILTSRCPVQHHHYAMLDHASLPRTQNIDLSKCGLPWHLETRMGVSSLAEVQPAGGFLWRACQAGLHTNVSAVTCSSPYLLVCRPPRFKQSGAGSRRGKLTPTAGSRRRQMVVVHGLNRRQYTGGAHMGR